MYQLLEKNPSITVLKSTKERKHKANILHRYKTKRSSAQSPLVQAGVLEAHNQDKQNATFSLGLSPWQRRCVHFRTNPDRNLTGEHRVYFCSRTVSYSDEYQNSWRNPPLRESLVSTLQILAHPFWIPEERLWSLRKEKKKVSHQSRKVMQEGEGENVNAISQYSQQWILPRNMADCTTYHWREQKRYMISFTKNPQQSRYPRPNLVAGFSNVPIGNRHTNPLGCFEISLLQA